MRHTIQNAVTAAEEESEEVTSEFTMGDITADAFVEKYMPLRKTYHRRNAALENSDRWLRS